MELHQHVAGNVGNDRDYIVQILKTLTKKELLYLNDVLNGLSLKESSYKNGTAIQTIKNSRKSIYRKFGVNSDAKLAVLIHTNRRVDCHYYDFISLQNQIPN